MRTPVFLLGLLFLSPIAATAQKAAPVATGELAPGELALEGKIVRIEATQLSLQATAFRNPNGKRGSISPSKIKIILWPRTSLNAQVGDEILVVGRHGAAAFVARQVTLLNAAPPLPSVPAASPQQPLLLSPQSPPFQVGDLTVRIEKAGFEEFTRLVSNNSPLSRVPMFYAILEVSGAQAGQPVVPRFVFRRAVGPRGHFVSHVFPYIAELPRDNDRAPFRFVYASQEIEPSWDELRLDVDVLPATGADNQHGTAGLTLEKVAIPRPGEVTLIGHDFKSSFGTLYRAESLERGANGQLKLRFSHQKPKEPRDLRIESFSFTLAGSSGGGGIGISDTPTGEDDISFPAPAGDVLKQIQVGFNEISLASQSRAGVKRLQLRFSPSDLLHQGLPVPPDQPMPTLSRFQSETVSVRLEPDGLNSGDDTASLLVWTTPPLQDFKRGLRWKVEKAVAKIAGQNGEMETILPSDESFSLHFHADFSPQSEHEEVQRLLVRRQERPEKFDLTLNYSVRAVLNTPFERTIAIPSGKVPVVPPDDGEGTLILRKIQRFSSPDDLPNFPQWIKKQWPNAGVALIFEANPLLVDADFFAHCLDAEDDQGRAIQTGVLIQNTLYQTDVTRKGDSKLYSLLLGEPAPDAKNIVIWLSTEENSRNSRHETVSFKDVPFIKPK